MLLFALFLLCFLVSVCFRMLGGGYKKSGSFTICRIEGRSGGVGVAQLPWLPRACRVDGPRCKHRKRIPRAQQRKWIIPCSQADAPMSDVTGMPKCAQQKSQGWTTFTPAARPLLQVRHARSSIAEVNSHYKQSRIKADRVTAASASVLLAASLLPYFKTICAFRSVYAYSCYIFTICVECIRQAHDDCRSETVERVWIKFRTESLRQKPSIQFNCDTIQYRFIPIVSIPDEI